MHAAFICDADECAIFAEALSVSDGGWERGGRCVGGPSLFLRVANTILYVKH